MRTKILMEIIMEGDTVACKEVVAVELERILLPIGTARVRCLGATIEEDEQASLFTGMRRRSASGPA